MMVLRLLLVMLAAWSLAGCQTKSASGPAPMTVRLHLESDAEQTVEQTLPVSGVKIHVLPKPVFSEFDLMNAEEAQVELGRCLLLQLSPPAARDLYRLSVANQGRRLVLLLDGRPLGARVIERPLTGGEILTFVEVPDAELPGLVQRLKQATQAIRREAAGK